jgi:hypothetical protein
MKSLKITLCLCLSLGISTTALSQNVGINTTGTNPDASAGLDVNYTDKGVLIPRVSLVSNTDVVTIPSPATSLLVYNNNPTMTGGAGLGFYYWNGTNWIALGGAAPASSGPVPGQQFYQNGRQVFPGPIGGCTTVPCGTTTNWVVPAGITMIRVQLAGAGGGSWTETADSPRTPSGACGGFVIGEIPVTPGETLTIFAGQGGRGYGTSNTDPRGGSGSYIARGATILAAAGGGGGSRRQGTNDGNGGGMAFGLAINGGNGSTGAGGARGQLLSDFAARLDGSGLSRNSGACVEPDVPGQQPVS